MKTNDSTVQQKIKVFRSFFCGLDHVYGTYDSESGKAKIIKRHVTDNVVYNHLKGIQPYGVYLLRGDKTKAAAIDFDSLDTFLPLSLIKRAKHYGVPCYVERSKSKGFHVWLFFEERGVLASKARTVIFHLLDEVECPPTEVFPKQDRLTPQKPYGNFINAPLFGALVPQGKTVFVDPDNSFEPYPDQWSVLRHIQRIPEQHLDEMIEVNQLIIPNPDSKTHPAKGSNTINTGLALLPCARSMLEQGVAEYQRVACFRLAIHLKKIGFPQDIAVSILKTWSKKNRPIHGKQPIAETEIIEQTNAAYQNSYHSYGCEEPAMRSFCVESCPVYKRIPTQRR